ncbi:fructosamine kinase, partial [Clavibacter phaseoli]
MAAAVSGTSGSAGAFRKEGPDAPRSFFEAEAAGLAWLAEAEPAGGARVVRVIDVAPGRIDLERLAPARPTREAA